MPNVTASFFCVTQAQRHPLSVFYLGFEFGGAGLRVDIVSLTAPSMADACGLPCNVARVLVGRYNLAMISLYLDCYWLLLAPPSAYLRVFITRAGPRAIATALTAAGLAPALRVQLAGLWLCSRPWVLGTPVLAFSPRGRCGGGLWGARLAWALTGLT